MKQKSADNFFDDVNFVSIVNNLKGIMTSDGTMSTLLDFERVIEESNVYAFKNWELGELVNGPISNKYTVKCIFMWPYKLMPDPTATKRLLSIGCNVSFAKTKIKVPIEVKNYDDFVQGTRYPKGVEKKVWLVEIEIPKHLMNELKEGSIDLADQTIDLEDIEQAYEEDLDKENTQQETQNDNKVMPAGQEGMAAGPVPIAAPPM